MLHAFGHSVAACCDVLRHVGYCWLKFENGQIFYAIFADVAWYCSRLARLLMFHPGMRTSLIFNSQHIATRRNILAKCTQYVVPNKVVICRVDRNVAIVWLGLANFGPTMLRYLVLHCWANNTQHVATPHNRVAKRSQHVVRNNVAISCVEKLRSFGQVFRHSHGPLGRIWRLTLIPRFDMGSRNITSSAKLINWSIDPSIDWLTDCMFPCSPWGSKLFWANLWSVSYF